MEVDKVDRVDMLFVGMVLDMELGMELDMVADMLFVGMALDMELGMELGMVADMLFVGMALDMEQGMALGMVADMLFVGMALDMELDMVEDMDCMPLVMDMGMGMDMDMDMVDIQLCKVPDKRVCRAAGIQACKAHKLARKGCSNRHHNDWKNILSKEVPKHPKEATRLIFPVVFSLKTPCVKVLFCMNFRISFFNLNSLSLVS
jgi:hypothetical protein